MNRQQKQSLDRTLSLSVVTVALAAAIALVLPTRTHDATLTTAQRDGIVQAVLSGKVKPDSSGMARLPDELREGVRGGVAYVQFRPDSRVLVFVPTIGVRGRPHGYAWCGSRDGSAGCRDLDVEDARALAPWASSGMHSAMVAGLARGWIYVSSDVG